jgi:hypothetical protein
MSLLRPQNELNTIFTEELYFMLLVTSAVRTLLSISQNGINPITLNKQLGSHLNMDITNASISFSFSFSGCFQSYLDYFYQKESLKHIFQYMTQPI